MKLTEAFPSNFLKADDLQGRDVLVTISDVQMEELGQGQDKDTKLVLSFKGKNKKLVCNKTNAKTIAKLYGDDTDEWLGKTIILGPREVEFQGEQVWAIRVSLRDPNKPGQPPVKTAPSPAPADDVPADSGGDNPW